ncbi:MAG: DinB family protein [Chloroflexi bacterium]|nr:DinB family protein [Chloroflexota bacterium]
MSAPELYLEAIRRADGDLKRSLNDLTTEELRHQPAGAGSNPIGWLVWHLTRTRDNIVSSIAGEKSVWDREGWAERFGMVGELPRFTPEDVQTFDPKDFATLVGYFDSVAEQTAKVVGGLTDADMTREVASTIAGRPAQPVLARLGVILNDNIQHTGQVAYLRGLIREHGWY